MLDDLLMKMTLEMVQVEEQEQDAERVQWLLL